MLDKKRVGFFFILSFILFTSTAFGADGTSAPSANAKPATNGNAESNLGSPTNSATKANGTAATNTSEPNATPTPASTSAAAPAPAATPTTPTPAANAPFKAEPGNPIVGKSKSEVCTACHGPVGVSVTPIWPSIAGQGEKYLIKEMVEFRKGDKGTRFDPSMFAMVQNLSDQDIADLAAYFASLKPGTGTTPANFLSLGEKIYRGGNMQAGIPACGPSCHGPRGEGLSLASIPRLSGQQAQYTIDQLKKFKSGARAGDPNSIMRDIAKRMSDEEIDAVSNYVSGLH